MTRTGDSSAWLDLTWKQGDWDTIEAVVIDGVLEECSVDNSAWRMVAGIGARFSLSPCFKPCTEWGGIGRVCLRMKVVMGSVYDVLVSSRKTPAKTRAVRVRAPWVHSAGRCLVSEGVTAVCGGSSLAWHGGLMQIGGPTQMATQGEPVTPLNTTMEAHGGEIATNGISFTTTKARPSTDMADMIYLSLDRGMRITRIVTVNTFSDAAIKRIRRAKTREEILVLCQQKYADVCVVTEHLQLPSSPFTGHSGWSYNQLKGSSVRPSSGVPGSVLWVADIPKDDCHLSVGSWLLGSIPLNTDYGISALFTRSISQLCDSAQGVVLVRPGMAWPKLVLKNERLGWSMTFIELQRLDELGVSVRTR